MATSTHQEEDCWLTRAELSARLKVASKTLAQWANLRRGPRYYRFGGGPVRYRLSDVIAWENEQLAPGGAA
ncbi:DNA-binding transcriptional regulator YiaG [Mycobacterium sp. MAA66]|uniref:helix-turn-helix transcriptional regulator n=1 Tax=Mycobacterium sp. MAA66 TaxID=3156297 RepID=UPI0035165823